MGRSRPPMAGRKAWEAEAGADMSFRVGRARVDAVTLETNATSLLRRSVAFRSTDDVASAIACTELIATDESESAASIRALCARAATPGPLLHNVAAVCVPPNAVATAKGALRETGVRVCSFTGIATSSAAPLAVKLAEVRAARDAGADEIEFAIDPSAALAADRNAICREIAAAREACEGASLIAVLDAHKLGRYATLRRAADFALECEADFIKGRRASAQTMSQPALALLFAQAVRERHRRTGRFAGLKLTGGFGSAETFLGYFALAGETLGRQWLEPGRLRLGTDNLPVGLVAARAIAHA
jgi:deoxyribose-phosphate aldolase